MNETGFQIEPGNQDDLAAVQTFLEPFMDGKRLLKRTSMELQLLLKHSFKAVSSDDTVIGFCALEVYSKKLAEIQCLAVDLNFQGRGIGKQMLALCLQRAKDEKIKELMAISSSDEMFKACGFDYSLPNQKRALFIQP